MKISVVTVAYNAAATIGETCAAVAVQTGVEIEHIIIDGGSGDATAAIVAARAHPGHIFVSEPDRGLYDAMNKGVARASGDLVGFLNADDFFCRTDALALVAAAAAPGVDAVCGGVAIVAADDVTRLRRAYPATGFAPWMLRFGHMPPHPGLYVRRDALAAVGAFDADLRICADFDWLLRFFHGQRCRMAAIAPTLVTMRDGGVSSQGWASRRLLNAEMIAALRRHCIASAPPLVWSKYLAKAGQLAARPVAWPAPAAVRWPPVAAPSIAMAKPPQLG